MQKGFIEALLSKARTDLGYFEIEIEKSKEEVKQGLEINEGRINRFKTSRSFHNGQIDVLERILNECF